MVWVSVGFFAGVGRDGGNGGPAGQAGGEGMRRLAGQGGRVSWQGRLAGLGWGCGFGWVWIEFGFGFGFDLGGRLTRQVGGEGMRRLARQAKRVSWQGRLAGLGWGCGLG